MLGAGEIGGNRSSVGKGEAGFEGTENVNILPLSDGYLYYIGLLNS